MRKYSNKKVSGFTLVELLVVISIIALLLSILMPSLGAARNSAKSVVCKARLRSIGQAIYTYQWPTLLLSYYGKLPTGGTGYIYWPDVLAKTSNIDPYSNLFVCPSVLPEKRVGSTYPESYGYMWPLLKDSLDVSIDRRSENQNGWPWYEFNLKKMLQKRGNCLMFGDSSYAGETDIPVSKRWAQSGWCRRDAPPSYGMGLAHLRHKKSGNFLFLDGHVETLRNELNSYGFLMICDQENKLKYWRNGTWQE